MSERKIKVTVDLPEGFHPMKAILAYKAKDHADFRRVVDAVGGPCAFKYHGHNSSHADLDDGHVLILEAPGHAPYEPPMDPCIRDLKNDCKDVVYGR